MDKEFIQIITQHDGIIYKVCKMYFQAEEDRKDLFQEILLHLWKAFPSFQAKAKVSTWMYRIALNTAITRLRKQKNKHPLEQLSGLSYQVPAIQDNPEDELHNMYEAIEKLSPLEKAIIMLYLEDCSYQEIGEIIGISSSNIGFKLNKIK